MPDGDRNHSRGDLKLNREIEGVEIPEGFELPENWDEMLLKKPTENEIQASVKHWVEEEGMKEEHAIQMVEKSIQIIESGRRDVIRTLLGAIDEMTGLLKKEAWNKELEAEMERAAREGKPVSVVITDLDKFKRLNDNLGHLAGDVAIKLIGKYINEIKRPYDKAGRFGGEEFAIILPGTSPEDAMGVAERLRLKIKEDFKKDLADSEFMQKHPEIAKKIEGTCDDERSPEKKVPIVLGTTSVGVSTFNGTESLSAEKLFKNADEALSEGAKLSRDKVMHHDDMKAIEMIDTSVDVEEMAEEMIKRPEVLDPKILEKIITQIPADTIEEKEAYLQAALKQLGKSN